MSELIEPEDSDIEPYNPLAYYSSAELMLLERGSVHAASVDVGAEAASAALHSLTLRTPEELRGSWPAVVTYNGYQIAYHQAAAIGDFAAMAKIREMQFKMVKEMY